MELEITSTTEFKGKIYEIEDAYISGTENDPITYQARGIEQHLDKNNEDNYVQIYWFFDENYEDASCYNWDKAHKVVNNYGHEL